MYDEDGYFESRIKQPIILNVDLDTGVKDILLEQLSPKRAYIVDTKLRELFQKGNSENVVDWCNSKSNIDFPIFEIKDPYQVSI